MVTKRPGFQKVVETIQGIFDKELSHLPAVEQKKKWDDLEKYLSAVAPGALPEQRGE
jgi:hypothetical protein